MDWKNPRLFFIIIDIYFGKISQLIVERNNAIQSKYCSWLEAVKQIEQSRSFHLPLCSSS